MHYPSHWNLLVRLNPGVFAPDLHARNYAFTGARCLIPDHSNWRVKVVLVGNAALHHLALTAVCNVTVGSNSARRMIRCDLHTAP